MKPYTIHHLSINCDANEICKIRGKTKLILSNDWSSQDISQHWWFTLVAASIIIYRDTTGLHNRHWVKWSQCQSIMGIFGSMTRVTQVSSHNTNISVEHQEPMEVSFHLGKMSTPQFSESKSVTTVAAAGVLAVASGVFCDCSLFQLEIFASTKLLTSDGAWIKTSASLINQVGLVGQKHKAFGLQAEVLVLCVSVRPICVTWVILLDTPYMFLFLKQVTRKQSSYFFRSTTEESWCLPIKNMIFYQLNVCFEF